MLWTFKEGGGVSILKHLYLTDYAEFDKKNSFIIVLHDNLLASEISTVRTLALIPGLH